MIMKNIECPHNEFIRYPNSHSYECTSCGLSLTLAEKTLYFKLVKVERAVDRIEEQSVELGYFLKRVLKSVSS